MLERREWKIAAVAALVVFVLAAAPARADLYLKQKLHTGSVTVMGRTQPEKDEVMVFWLGANRSRTDTGDSRSSIFLADKGILYVLDHEKLTYMEMPLDLGETIDQAMAGRGEEGGRMAAMMKRMTQGFMGNISVKVTETGETRRIGSWDCRKYLIDIKLAGGETQSEAWATEDIKADARLYFSAANAMMAGQPGFAEMVKEMQKVKGVIVLQTSKTKMMGSEVVSTTELLEGGEKTPPAGAYEVPSGYKKVKFGKG
jgi:hypothetical protein